MWLYFIKIYSPVPDEYPSCVESKVDAESGREGWREYQRVQVELGAAVLDEDGDDEGSEGECEPEIDHSPDGEGPAGGCDVELVLVRQVTNSGEEDALRGGRGQGVEGAHHREQEQRQHQQPGRQPAATFIKI